MKGRKIIFLLWGILTISPFYVLPALIIAENDAVINLSWYSISNVMTLAISVFFLCVFMLMYFKHYKLSLFINSVVIIFYCLMLFSSKLSVDKYQHGPIKYNYVTTFIFMINLFAIFIYIMDNMQSNIKIKKIEVLIKHLTSIFVFGLVFTFGFLICRGNSSAMETEEYEGYTSSCGGMGIVVEDDGFENEVYEIGEKISIKYLLPERFPYSEFEIFVESKDGINVSTSLVNENDKTTGFWVSIKVEHEIKDEIEISLFLDKNKSQFIYQIPLFIYAENGVYLVDRSALAYCEERYYLWQLENGKIDLLEYNKKIEDMFKLDENDEGVIIEDSVSDVSTISNNITVTGTIKWTDIEGKTHPANEIRVEIMDEDLVFDDVITAVYTDSNGKYTATFPNDTSLTEGGYDIYVRIYARGRYTQVVDKNKKIYSYDIDIVSNDVVGGNTYIKSTTFGNNKTYAFMQVQQAVSMASYYVYKVEGKYLDTVYVMYPDNTKDICQYTNDNYIHVMSDYYSSWDVLQHEYGHHVIYKKGFNISPGDTHYVDLNMADYLKDKDKGIKLAWNEGWSTYFAIGLQNYLKAKEHEIPYVGDVNYTDLKQGFTNNIESWGKPLGEANETSVAAILYDISDSGTNESWDTFSMGFVSTYKLVVDNKCTTLSSFIKLVHYDNLNRKVRIGSILSKYGASSKLVSPSDGTKMTTSAPTFYWSAKGGSSLYPNNSFTLVFYSSKNKIIAQAGVGNKTSYTLPDAFWKVICNATSSGEKVYWTVISYQTDAPSTGPYFSDNRYFYVP